MSHRGQSGLAWGVWWFGLLFLYAPVVSLVIYSFNESRLVTVWAGFSTRWYGELWHDSQILEAAALSLRVATASALLAGVLGTLVALALVRHGHFRGRALISFLVTAPLVMPEVLLGLSLLLLFVALEQGLGWPAGRGVVTLIIAHATIAVAYVTVVVQSRLAQLDPQLEEAALDLGATPFRVFTSVTLPLIAPAVVSGVLLAFTLSLDDVVVASFVSGPGASTLPMVIYSKVRLGLSPVVNALASLWLLLVALGATVAFALIWQRSSLQAAAARTDMNEANGHSLPRHRS
jgi:putrescine transport system permease protein